MQVYGTELNLMASREMLQLADDLERVLDGKLSIPSLRAHYSHSFELILSNLEHYEADSDIRRKDPTYAKMQNEEMAKLISLLRSGASLVVVEKISFLHPS